MRGGVKPNKWTESFMQPTLIIWKESLESSYCYFCEVKITLQPTAEQSHRLCFIEVIPQEAEMH